MPQEKNRVTVRVWLASSSLAMTSNLETLISVGHVSLRTYIGGPDNTGHYISFWPASPAEACRSPRCEKRTDHVHTEEEDIGYMGAAHIDHTFTLYSLDPNLMNSEYEKRVAAGLRWSVRGSLIEQDTNQSENCSSLVFRLLVAGGLERLLNRNQRMLVDLEKYGFYSSVIGLGNGVLWGAKLLNETLLILKLEEFALTEYARENMPNLALTSALTLARTLQKISIQLPSQQFLSFRIINTLYEQCGRTGTIAIAGGTLAVLTCAAVMTAKALLNIHIVKPSDFVALMKKAIASERSIYGTGLTLFENRRTNERIHPTVSPQFQG